MNSATSTTSAGTSAVQVFFYHGSSDRIVTMTTTDPIIKLPAGYEDWVEVAPIVGQISPHRIVVTFEEYLGHGSPLARYLGTKVFVRPKPKPVLPDVKPGAVVRFTSKTGKPERAVRNFESWSIYGAGTSGRMNVRGDSGWSLEWSDADLLARVDADGFTVELEGL